MRTISSSCNRSAAISSPPDGFNETLTPAHQTFTFSWPATTYLHAVEGGGMVMGWFLPLGVLIGALGTQTAFRAHHALGAKSREKGWLLLLAMAWLPSVCWVMAQVVKQG
jgi:hypothetical protein